MPITVISKRSSRAVNAAAARSAVVLDVTSGGSQPWVQFSPFYPHRGIPVPFSPGRTSASVEGVWQALKVFQAEDVDPSVLTNASMKNLKRTVRSHGRMRGHREGLSGDRLLGYVEARRVIYLPTYRWVLENLLVELTERLRSLASNQEVVLLDFTTNGDIGDVSQPLSHAALIKAYVENRWPDV